MSNAQQSYIRGLIETILGRQEETTKALQAVQAGIGILEQSGEDPPLTLAEAKHTRQAFLGTYMSPSDLRVYRYDEDNLLVRENRKWIQADAPPIFIGRIGSLHVADLRGQK